MFSIQGNSYFPFSSDNIDENGNFPFLIFLCANVHTRQIPKRNIGFGIRFPSPSFRKAASPRPHFRTATPRQTTQETQGEEGGFYENRADIRSLLSSYITKMFHTHTRTSLSSRKRFFFTLKSSFRVMALKTGPAGSSSFRSSHFACAKFPRLFGFTNNSK